MICDDKCLQWWHADCVNLKGLKEEQLEMIKDWECPRCLVSPYQLMNNGNQTGSSAEVATKGDIESMYKLMKDSVNVLTSVCVEHSF